MSKTTIKPIATVMLALSAIMAMSLASANTEMLRVVNVTESDMLNMRSGPSTQFPVIVQVPHNGVTLTSTGRRDGNWAEVSWLGQQGWVHANFVQAMQTGVAPDNYGVVSIDTSGIDQTDYYRPTQAIQQGVRPKYGQPKQWKAPQAKMPY